ncbi:PREDICTED: protein decapping 5 [Nicotiana attenuata]|uniref:Protein decapping 5 n=1 Tax=Nicotiana attenuata TaxID=49451 RepID=A0A1J6KHF1_NICAT|nr:PREDICTED: protein decapping 5 [Nicotiana attenuata]OIT21287.1 protein decapping 5 [Nicotiana attenuata]
MAAAAATESSSARSASGGSSADSYIGSLISLTSKSEIRYEGILYNINTDESSIGLRNVRSFGTEGRKKDGPQVPPSDKIYEYILFRGSDIKDLQVKSSPPLQTTPPINNDPAIIQSHYPRPPTTSASVPAPVGGSLTDLSSHSAQPGHPGSAFQSGLPLYQPGGNLGSWGPSPPPPNAGAGGLGMPMYWQGFYGAPNGLPQMQQQSLLRPPPGLAMPPSMPQMQFSGFNSSLPTGGSSLQASNLPEYPSSLMPTTTSLGASSLPAATLPSTVPPLQPVAPVTETISSTLSNKTSVSAIAPSTLSASLPTLPPLTTSPDVPPISIKPNPVPSPALSQSVSTVMGPSSSNLVETPTPSLVTPGQLLQSGPIDVPSTQSTQTAQKDVEVVQVLPAPSSETPAPVKTEAQPPILPLPPQTRVQKTNGAPYQARYNNYRGRGGRGMGVSRPVTKFEEDFDFMAMNEKFKKDEVWGHLGKSNREGDGNGSDEDVSFNEYDDDLPKIDVKPVYNKDDFFDSLSSNALDNDPNHGRTRFSEQRKIDVETFGDFSRYRGGRGGRGPGRGGRSRGSYYGRGGYGGYSGNGYGYGYGGRGRGRGMPSRAS